MSASIPYAGGYPHVVDVNAKVINQSKVETWAGVGLVSLVVLLMVVAVASWFHIDTLKSEKETLTHQTGLLSKKIANLEGELASTSTVRNDLASAKRALEAEIQRKNAIAVENTRLKGRITQAERDLEQALAKLRVYQKPKVPPKKK